MHLGNKHNFEGLNSFINCESAMTQAISVPFSDAIPSKGFPVPE